MPLFCVVVLLSLLLPSESYAAERLPVIARHFVCNVELGGSSLHSQLVNVYCLCEITVAVFGFCYTVSCLLLTSIYVIWNLSFLGKCPNPVISQ